MLSGEDVSKKIISSDGRVAKLISSGKASREIIEELYLGAVSRHPDAGEVTLALRSFARSPSVRQAAEDLLWALLNTREFAYIR